MINKYKKIVLTCLCLGLALTVGAFTKADNTATIQVAPNQVEKLDQTTIDSTVADLETLFVLMQERMSLMHDLARYKWNHGINHKTLDNEILKSEIADSELQEFLAAQNKAADKILQDDFALFRNEEVVEFENVKDYKATILPHLESVNTKMIETVQDLLAHTQKESLPHFLRDISFSSFRNEGIDKSVYDIAVEPLFDSK